MAIGKVVYNTLAEFGARTTIGGLCNAGLTSSRPRQIYWLVIFFAMFFYTIKLLVDNVNQYLQYGVITSTNLDYNSSIYFPSVTICNQNRYNNIIIIAIINECLTVIPSQIESDGQFYNSSLIMMRILEPLQF